jgi:hypothetical protein
VRVLARWALGIVVAVAACTDDLDPPWQLDHDRIIAVRATPPQIAPGERAVVDALVGYKGEPVAELSPDDAAVVSPASLAGTLARDAAGWVITAPSAVEIDAARAELGLPPTVPVPLELRVRHAGGALTATKIVRLGGAGDNPDMTDVQIDRASPGSAPVVVASLIDVPLTVPLDDATYDVTWLSSCGTLHDFDLPTAYLRVEAHDPHAGQLVLVVRDASGGVNWRVWSIDAR